MNTHAAVKTYHYHDNKLITVSTLIIWTVSNIGNHKGPIKCKQYCNMEKPTSM